YCQRAFSSARCSSTEFQSSYVQYIEGDNVSTANFPEHIFNRHFTILKIELNSRGTFNPHLMFFPPLRKSFHTFFYDKGCEFIPIYFSKYSKNVGETTVGNPAFLSIQQIIFPVIR